MKLNILIGSMQTKHHLMKLCKSWKVYLNQKKMAQGRIEIEFKPKGDKTLIAAIKQLDTAS